MREKIMDIYDLTDSRLMFDRKPPAFGYCMILIAGGFLIIAVILSMIIPKKYIIQAHGTVSSEEANYVMCTYTGAIDKCNMTEGMLVNKGDVLFTVKSTDFDLQEEQLERNLEDYKEKAEKYQLLVDSIRDDTNYFNESDKDNELYYSNFEAYKAQVEQNRIDTSTYSSYGYTDEQIESEIKKNQAKIAEIYYEAVQSAENAKAEAESQIESVKAQLAAISSGKDSYAVTATAAGILHMMEEYRPGMVVQTADTIASISQENSSKIIEAYVSTSDMARMHNGDYVQIAVDGLSQSVYGVLDGKVKQIDSNVTMQQGSNGTAQNVFRVKIEMDIDYLTSHSGDKVDITNGMTVTARIQYDKVTWMTYILEKLGFIAR